MSFCRYSYIYNWKSTSYQTLFFAASTLTFGVAKPITMSKVSENGIYRKAAFYADLTKRLIIHGQLLRVKKCLAVAEKIFSQGNAEMKNAVINVYMFSLISFLERQHCNIRDLLTGELKDAYIKQLNAVSK